jgi:nifR3 family TIM-barrel protein
MDKNFWEKLNPRKDGARKPIYALAPMAGVTDSAFRRICKSFGADVVYSEMASATALAYAPQKTLEMIKFSEAERPYVAQLFGSEPEHFAQAVKLLTNKKRNSKLLTLNSKFCDGIDINFGCPVKKVRKQGAGAVLMDNLKLAREIIKSVIDNTDLPVSVKIRSKAGRVDALRFLDNVSDLNIKAVMIHGRTLSQGFAGEVDWKIIKKAREFFNGIILANGGVMSAEDARELLEKTEADGVGIARGALGRPWIFQELKEYKSPQPPFTKGGNNNKEENNEIFKIALRHAKLAEKLKGNAGIKEMRKHLCWYVAGLPNARKLRQELVRVETLKDIKKIFQMNNECKIKIPLFILHFSFYIFKAIFFF